MKVNSFLARSRKKNNEPFNASLVTVIIAFVFVGLGNVNSVAEIISMFFYGNLRFAVFNLFSQSLGC